MRRGDATREHIVEQAASLFNQKGFSGASVADIMEATGLKKGGIYRHFETKEALAIEAFGYSVGRMRTRFVDAQAGRSSPLDRLRAIISVFSDLQNHPAVPGGCPIMNAAIDSDDGNALLRLSAREAMDDLRRLIRSNLEQAVAGGEAREDLDPDQVTTVFVAALEGGLMLSGLYDDPTFVRHAVQHLEQYLDWQVIDRASGRADKAAIPSHSKVTES